MQLTNITKRLTSLNRFQILLILTALGLFTYANAVNHPFVHDDIVFIQLNPHIADLNPKAIFFQTSVPASHSPLINQYYRPLLEILNRVLYRMFGFNPQGFHFFNIMLHIMNSFLVYGFMGSITGKNKGLSLAAAILFLVHPVQSESVACISGISNLVFAFLCLASFNLYFAAIHREDKRTRPALYAMALTVFFLALLAKEQSVILPFLIIAYEISFADGKIKKAAKEYWLYCAGFFIVLAGYFLIRKILFGFAITPVPGSQAELGLRLLAIPRSLLMYFKIIVFPHGLYYYRSQDILLPHLGPILLLSAVVVAFTFLIAKMPQPNRRWMIFGLAWFFISLLPTLNIIPLINEYSTVQTAEHFLYFPVIGIIVFLLSIGQRWIGRSKDGKGTGFAYGSLMLICLVCIGITTYQNTFWRGEIPLFKRTLQYQPNFGRVHFLLAKAYSNVGRYEEAIEESQKALTIMQGYLGKIRNEKVEDFYLRFITEINYHIGFCFDILGERGNALVYFRNAVNLDPEDSVMNYALGLAYLKQDDIGSAIAHFERSFALKEDNLMAANSLALCYEKIGKYDKAEKLLRTIVKKDSGSLSARENLDHFLSKRNNP